MRFAIFTHVIHQLQDGRYFAYSPYVREMNIWLKHVEEVEVVASSLPKTNGTKGELVINDAYRHPRLTLTKIPSFDLLNFVSFLQAIFKIPIIIFKTTRAMKRADHLHLRCPGNVGLLACVCQVFFPGKPKTAKYAGNWDPEAKQPWTYRIQKWILSNTFLSQNMQVLVYGEWSNQTKNILPFFTASFSEKAKEVVEKDIRGPFKFLFVGNLVDGKQPFLALETVKALNEKNIPAEIHIYGDGPLFMKLEKEAEKREYMYLHGKQTLDFLKEAYKESHFLILASRSEGWPKAVAEAMFFGCIPIATSVSCVPWMLDYGNRGILIQNLEKRGEKGVVRGQRTEDRREVERQVVIDETVEKIIELIRDPEEMRRMSLEAQEWSQQYTLEGFEEAIKEVLFSEDVRP